MKVSRVRDVKFPSRGTELSAGIDFFVPEFDADFVVAFNLKNDITILTTAEGIHLMPGQRVLIPSGIRVNFSGEPKVLVGFNKSGLSAKNGLDVLACVVDQDYQGEIHLSVLNTSRRDTYTIKPGSKLVQFIVLPVVYEPIEPVADAFIWEVETDRGAGGFGSTGSK